MLPRRIAAGALAAVLGLNGLVMLLAGPQWYVAVPGVTGTGPFNGHFVKDIGAVYLVVAAALAWFAARPRDGWAAVVPAAAFLTLHALVHVTDAVVPGCGAGGGVAALVRDLPGVFLPALLTIWIALGRPPIDDFKGA